MALTKPDALTESATTARQRWKDIIEGRSHKLQHGYYCVKLADDETQQGIFELYRDRVFDPKWHSCQSLREFCMETGISRKIQRFIDNDGWKPAPALR